MKAELSYDSFFQGGRSTPQLNAVLARCASHGEHLHVALDDQIVTVSATAEAKDARTICVRGRWRSELLRGSYDHPGALLLSPFLFAIQELSFPSQMLYTMGRATRSAADMCMRNFFYAAIRRESVRFLAATGEDRAQKASRDLARTYLWITKANLPEDLLKGANAAELILASAHAPIGAFSSVLLETGAYRFRQTAALTHRGGDAKQAFFRVRERMMALYEA